ncbi:MAG: hypothetical protein ACOYKE_06865, partial [Ferruginibacter sp.]
QAKYLFWFSAIAFTLKLLLQLGSTIPYLSTLAFGIRPIIIGYLHLVLLGVISLFILGYAFKKQCIEVTIYTKIGAWIFPFGIILTEMGLMCEGIAALNKQSIDHINLFLLFAALLMVIGIILLNKYSFFTFQSKYYTSKIKS